MNRYSCLLCLVAATLFACNDAKPKAIAHQPAKDSLRAEDSIDIEAASVKADDYYDNSESPFDTLIGCWDAIRAGNITITFSKDSTFEFYDYNSTKKEEELLTGKFEVEGSILTLFYNDRPKQRFTFKKDPEANYSYRITNATGYYFVKSHC